MVVTAPSVSLSGAPTLHTERLVLRVPQRGDYSHWSAFATSQRAQYIGGPLSDELAWRALGHLTGHWVHRGYGMFIFSTKDSDIPLGMAGPWYPEGWPEHEIGWSVWAPAAEGKGYAYEAALAARAFAYDVLGWTTAVSYVHPENQRSSALARRLGAVLDDSATQPFDDEPCLIYRHPAPGVVQ
jgi:RimJ/RimL family protein N-acetyltransferase